MENIYSNFTAERIKINNDKLRELRLLSYFAYCVMEIITLYRDITPLEIAGRLNLSMEEYLECLFNKTPLTVAFFLNVCGVLNIKYSAIITLFDEYKKTEYARSYLSYQCGENQLLRDDIQQWLDPLIENFYQANALDKPEE